MLCEIKVEPDYLRADLYDRQTGEETRQALEAIAASARKHGRSQILISVHASRPLFKTEPYGLPDHFRELGEIKRYRIALTADSPELRLSQQYIEVLALRNGINVRSFRTEQAALDWFKDRRWLPDRRRAPERWDRLERRQHRSRRALELRLDSV
jgi:hypothetical protein